MRALLAAPVVVIVLAGLACVTTTTPNTGPSGSCPLPTGTFTEHFTSPDAGGCPDLPDRVLTLDGSSSFTTMGVDDDAGGVTSCTTDVDPATCTYNSSCTTTVDGGTAQVVTAAVTFDGDSAKGREVIEPNTCSTDICTYGITITKT
jgi:hypothetical protein